MARRSSVARRVLHAGAFGPEALEARQLLSSSLNNTGDALATVGVNQHPHSAPILTDFTGDGIKDLVYGAGKNVLLARGLGGGEFDRPTIAGSASATIGLLAAGDFNGDGKLDLASAADLDGVSFVVRTLLNTGNGTFSRDRARKVFGRVDGLAVGNVEGSATPEIVTTSRRLFITFGDNQANAIRSLPTSHSDFGNFPGAPNHELSVLSVGPGSIGAPRAIASANELTAPVIANLDNTGVSEIVIAGLINPFIFQPLAGSDFVATESKVSIFRSTNDGGFAEIRSVEVSGSPSSVGVGDADGDGRLDIAYASISLGVDTLQGSIGGSVQTLLQTPNKALGVITLADPVVVYNHEFPAIVGTRPQRLLVPSMNIIGVSDVNTDGSVDISLSTQDDINYPRSRFERTSEFVLIQDVQFEADPAPGPVAPTLTLRRVVTTGAPVTDGTVPSRLPVFTLADTTNDGRQDLLVWNRASFTGPSRLQVFRNTVAQKAPIIDSIKGGFINAFAGDIKSDFAPGENRYAGNVFITNPEVMRSGTISRVTAYFDSNNNGVFDSADQVATQAELTTPIKGALSIETRWTFEVSVPSETVIGRLFVEAVGSNGLSSVASIDTNPFIAFV
jgi:hypothetical protein